jgi:hypothetical protein
MEAAEAKVDPTTLPTETPLKNISVRREDARELDRLFGRASYADRVAAMIAVIKRSRKVEEVRRKILGLEELPEHLPPTAGSTGSRIIGGSSPEPSLPGRARRRRRA